MSKPADRRPLASRDTALAHRITRWLAGTKITPNQISMASMVMAAGAGACFWAAGQAQGGGRPVLLIAAAALCQMRLLCNLFDGMVAIEAGKHADDGAFWNEFPDRIADILILVGAGLGAGLPGLGWAAAAGAVLTAYVRELGRTCGLPADYSGPMAKPQRMALLTAAAVLSMLEPLWDWRGQIIVAALAIVAVGTAITVLRRAYRIVTALQSGSVS